MGQVVMLIGPVPLDSALGSRTLRLSAQMATSASRLFPGLFPGSLLLRAPDASAHFRLEQVAKGHLLRQVGAMNRALGVSGRA